MKSIYLTGFDLQKMMPKASKVNSFNYKNDCTTPFGVEDYGGIVFYKRSIPSG